MLTLTGYSVKMMGRRAVLALAIIALSACGQMPQPFGKQTGRAPSTALVSPPPQTFEKAGPGAANQIDYETVEGPSLAVPADVAAFHSAAPAAAASPGPAATQMALPAASSSKPKVSIAAVVVEPVEGDSRTGELTAAMRDTLDKAGWPVRSKAGADTMKIMGRVRIGEPQGSVQPVSLAWEVVSPDGTSLGVVNQKNDVPAGSLKGGWGESAAAATEAAAGGIFELIDNYR